MTRKEKLTDELNLIQNQIQRMAGNSFIIKGWYITFISAFGTYIFSKNDFSLIPLAVFPFLGCLIYDCYFLYLERLYREKYFWVINNINDDRFLFDLNPYNKEMLSKSISPINIIFSKPIIGFYLLPFFILLIWA